MDTGELDLAVEEVNYILAAPVLPLKVKDIFLFSSSAESDSEADEGGGYDEKMFVDPPDDDLKCPVCLAIARDPMQTPCGHLFCSPCFQKLPIENRRFIKCPQDRKKHRKDKIFPDERTRRKIMQMKVKCKKSKSGCKAEIELEYLENHMKKCGYVKETCPLGCGQWVQRSSIATHEQNDCSNREISCQYCKRKMMFKCLPLHQRDDCKQVPVTCVKCDKQMVKEKFRCHMSEGIKDGCPKAVVRCEYFEVGCTFKGQRRLVGGHLRDNVHQHMQLLLTQQREMREEMLSFKTYQQIEEPSSFLWAIENWRDVERKEGEQTILSRKFQLEEHPLRLQMAIQCDSNLFSARIYVHPLTTSPLTPKAVRFELSMVGEHPNKESREIKLEGEKVLLVHYYRQKVALEVRPENGLVEMNEFPLQGDGILLIKFSLSLTTSHQDIDEDSDNIEDFEVDDEDEGGVGAVEAYFDDDDDDDHMYMFLTEDD